MKALLEKYGLRPKRGFGQNFLINQGVLQKIVAAVDPQPGESILEIGPGIGVMTRMLAERGAHVLAVDADPQMIQLLQQELDSFDNVTLVHSDILQFTLPSNQQFKVVGNIPYNISSPIFFWLVAHCSQITSAVLTMQREVAERLVAAPGTKTYGALTIALQAAATAERLFNIQPRSFWPAPKVTSATVRLTFPNPPPYAIDDRARFRDIVRTAFTKRRKMIRNSIPREVLAEAGIDPTRRPETLTIQEFIDISRYWQCK